MFLVGAANALASPFHLATESCVGSGPAPCQISLFTPYSVPIWSFTVANPLVVLGLVALSVVLAVIGFHDARVTHDTRVVVYAQYIEFLPLLTLIVLGIAALFLYPPLH